MIFLVSKLLNKKKKTNCFMLNNCTGWWLASVV